MELYAREASDWEGALKSLEVVSVGRKEEGRSTSVSPALPRLSSYGDVDTAANASSALFDDEEACTFHLMRISITVYTLTGMLCRSEEPQNGTRWVSKRKCEDDKLKRRPSNVSSVPKTDFDFPSEVPPTTAVVSAKRNAISSGTAIETFLPSLALNSLPPNHGCVFRQNASWPGDRGSVLLEKNRAGRSTFEIIRVMQREAYNPHASIAHIANYVPETIDLNVSLGRGKELIPLGVASLVVTGDEEGEVIATIPVKPSIRMLHHEPKRRGFRNARKGKPKRSFSSQPNQLYSLDDNATLRIGVRVVPQGAPHAGIAERDNKLRLDHEALDDILGGFYDENKMLEFRGENSVIEKLLRGRKGNRRAVRVSDEPRTPEPILRSFFCGAMQMCTAAAEGSHYIDNTIPRSSSLAQQESEGKDTMLEKAVVLPWSLLSSVSGSTEADVMEAESYIFQKKGTIFQL